MCERKNEMKNCQRCQTEPKVRIDNEFDKEQNEVYYDFQIYCEKCFMAGPVSNSSALAIERWNKIEYDMSIADMEKRITEIGEQWDKDNPLAAISLNRGSRT